MMRIEETLSSCWSSTSSQSRRSDFISSPGNEVREEVVFATKKKHEKRFVVEFLKA